MELQELKSELKKILTTNYEQVHSILIDDLLSNKVELYSAIIVAKAKVSYLGRDRDVISVEDYRIGRNQIIESTIYWIDSMDEEDLKENWKENEFLMTLSPNDNNEIEKNNITIPLYKIEIPESARRNSNQEKQFRMSMTSCQDAIAIENYVHAYKECEYIRERLECESAQLYEYLLFSYYKKETAERIIEDKISRGGKMLNHIILYANRLKEYQNNRKCPTNTGLQNIERISADLAFVLNKKLLEHSKNYINDNLQETNYQFSFVKKCLECGDDLQKHLLTPIDFFENVMNEFLGGGFYPWIEIARDRKGNQEHLINNPIAGFNTLGTIERLRTLLKAKKETTDLKVERKLTGSLYRNLVQKYHNIQPSVNGKVMRWEDKHRQALIRCHKAFKIAYLFFRENRFLKYPLEELQEKGKLLWFEVNGNAEMTGNSFSNRLNYDAVTELKWFLEKNDTAFEGVQKAILKRCAHFLANQTAKEYAELQQISRFSPNEKQVINCLDRWLLCAKITGDTKYNEYCLNEITGNGILTWLNTDSKLEALQELKRLGDDKFVCLLEISRDDVIKQLIYRKFGKLKLEYEAISDEKGRARMVEMLEECKKYYAILQDNQFIDFLIVELEGRGKFNWIWQILFFKFNNLKCKQLKFDALAALANLNSIKKDS
jgi:hypothetical protein